MPASSTEPGSRYLASRLRTLYDVCRDGGRDDNGRACATCPVADICARDLASAQAAIAAAAAAPAVERKEAA